MSKKYNDKYLVVPSSRSEFLGHRDYKLNFKNSIECLNKFIEFINLTQVNLL